MKGGKEGRCGGGEVKGGGRGEGVQFAINNGFKYLSRGTIANGFA